MLLGLEPLWIVNRGSVLMETLFTTNKKHAYTQKMRMSEKILESIREISL